MANNESTHNGLQEPGAGAGVGIFAPGPGNQAYSNVVVNNLLKDNGLPGVALHNHVASAGGNIIEEETEDIVTNTPAEVNVHFNDLLGGQVGVNNIGTGTVNATENWWESSRGPGSERGTKVEGTGVTFTPWLRLPILESQR